MTRKPVEKYRDLAHKAPDAYTPNLASSLSEVGRHEEALEVAREAVEALAPHFMALPKAYQLWMATMVRNYRARCAATDTETDLELLGPIEEKLAALSQEQE